MPHPVLNRLFAESRKIIVCNYNPYSRYILLQIKQILILKEFLQMWIQLLFIQE